MRMKNLAHEELYCIEISANDIDQCFKYDGWEARCEARLAEALAFKVKQVARLAALGRPAQTIYEAFAR